MLLSSELPLPNPTKNRNDVLLLITIISHTSLSPLALRTSIVWQFTLSRTISMITSRAFYLISSPDIHLSQILKWFTLVEGFIISRLLRWGFWKSGWFWCLGLCFSCLATIIKRGDRNRYCSGFIGIQCWRCRGWWLIAVSPSWSVGLFWVPGRHDEIIVIRLQYHWHYYNQDQNL